jgi:hypothetical protein
MNDKYQIRLPYRLPSADHQHCNLTSLAELILQNHVAPSYNATDIEGPAREIISHFIRVMSNSGLYFFRPLGYASKPFMIKESTKRASPRTSIPAEIYIMVSN